jgi:UDP-galactopyranose mutase
MIDADVVIVGCGLSGAVLAEQFASILHRSVLLIEKRDHIAGNCYDYQQEGILVNKYGAHLFHTNDEGVWDYINKFSDWVRWDHRVVGHVDGKLVPIPVNINTVNGLCGTNLQTPQEMQEWLSRVQIKTECVENSKQMALSRVGQELYEKIFHSYTWKQWNRDPLDLDPSVLARIPIRDNFDDRYFQDRFQALPQHGYTHFVKNMISHPNIKVLLNTDFFQIQSQLRYNLLFFTGPIDAYFQEKGLENLEYRSIEFQVEVLKNTPYFQPNSVVNYPQYNVPFTRIVEYKHFLHQQSPHTIIVREFPCEEGEPYYPVPNEKNQQLYEQYRQLALKEEHVYFVGRLANYKYFNMDQTIRNALDFFQQFLTFPERKENK